MVDKVWRRRNGRISVNDMKKTKQELVRELQILRKKIDGLERSVPRVTPLARSSKKRDERYAGFYENAVEGFFQSTPDGRFLDVNPAFARMHGYSTPEELLSSISDITHQYYVHPEDRQRFMELLSEKGFVSNYEYKVRHRNGSEIWVSESARAVFDKKGHVTRYEGIVQDITGLKRAEEEIQRSEARMTSLIQILQYKPASQQDFLDYALSEAIKLTGSKIGYIYFYSEEKREFTLNTWSRDVMNDCRISEPQTVYQLDRTGLWGEAVRQRKVIVINDFQAPHPLKRGYPQGHAHLARFMTVPVFSGDRIVAVAGVANKETDYDKLDELQLFLLMDSVWRAAEQKQVEETLRLRDAKITSLFRAAPVGIGMVVNRVLQEVNETLCQMTGFTREELIGKDARMLYPTQEDYEFVGLEKYRQIGQEGTGTVETDWRRKDGSIFPIILRSSPLDVADLSRGVTFTVLDITEHKKAESALKRSEEMFREAFHTSPDSITINRLHDGIYISVNEGFTKNTNYTEEDVEGKTPLDINIWDSSDDLKKLVKGLKQRGEVRNMEASFRRKNGDILYGLISASMINIGGIPHILSVTRDITKRKKAEDAMQQSEKKFRDLAELLPQVVFEFDLQGRFTYVNRYALNLFGYSQTDIEQGLNALDMIAPADRDRAAINIMKIERKEKETGTEYTAVRKNGEEFPVIIYLTPIHADEKVVGLRGILVDMTERKQLESQLIQAQKLEAVGTLAGGMAHNFNNILTGIQGHASLMLMDLSPGHPHYNRLRSIEEQVSSGADLTRQLLGFARGGRYEVNLLNINTVVGKTAEMFGKTKREIVFHLDLAGQTLNVMADQSQMEQMLMNLFVNAWQAMPAGGDIYLQTRRLLPSASDLLSEKVSPGPYAKISVRDTGTGMDDETSRRIFEPFFTTKQMGRGTGLGLASVYGIVKGHKGTITVHSERGQGTTFHIYLPISEEAPGKNRIRPESDFDC
jgi:two-component system cell cycle sensor histidine kinase/response regulator CckA